MVASLECSPCRCVWDVFVVDGCGGGGVHCGGDVLVMFSLWFALSAVHNNKKLKISPFSTRGGRGRGEDCAGILWLMAIVDGGRGGVLGMLALPMCAGCVVVDGGGGDCGCPCHVFLVVCPECSEQQNF